MQLFKAQLNKATSELDKTLAILGLFFTSILAIWIVINVENLMIRVAIGLAVLACAGYLVIRKRLPSSIVFSSAQPASNSRLRMILNIFFFSVLSYSVLSIYLRPELYTRPLSYFVSIALMVTILALEILLLPSKKGWTYFTLLKVMLIGLSVEWSLLLLFPGILGVDPWFHQNFTLELLESGHIPEYSGYSKLPFMHLTVGATSLITGLNFKMATMFSISLLQMVSDVLFIFLLGRLMYNDRVGLASALFLSIANMHAHFGIWTIPMTAGGTLILPIIYLLFKTRQEKPITAFSLVLLLMAALNLTHAIATSCMAILLFVFWAGFEVHKRIRGEKFILPVTPILAILFSVMMLGWWMHATWPHFVTFVSLFQWGFSKEFWGTPSVTEAIKYMSLNVPPSEWIFGTSGMLLFFTFSLIGCFYMVGKRFGNKHSFAIAIGGVTLLALPFLSQVAGLRILEERWLYFTQIVLAIPLGVAIVLLSCAVLNNKLVKMLFMISFSFLISFLMIMSPQVNMDNRTFTPNTALRFAFTESEQQAAGTISNMWDGDIGTDIRYGLLIPRRLDIDESLYRGDFSNCQDALIIIREEIVKYPFGIRRGFIKLHYDPYQALEEQGFYNVYNCGSVSGFIKIND